MGGAWGRGYWKSVFCIISDCARPAPLSREIYHWLSMYSCWLLLHYDTEWTVNYQGLWGCLATLAVSTNNIPKHSGYWRTIRPLGTIYTCIAANMFKDKETTFLKVKGLLLYSCLLIAPLPSWSSTVNWHLETIYMRSTSKHLQLVNIECFFP